MSIPVIAIDGPSGSGKGTVAAAVAKRLGFHFLDSGALYRLVGHAALTRDVSLDDPDALAELARSMDVVFDFGSEGADSVRLDGEAVGEAIRSEAVAGAASRVAAEPKVRDALLDLQKGFRRPPGLVADGRDMGTVVFPDAVCKLFLTASAEERASRRYKQLKEKGIDVKFPALLGEIRVRDERDRNRSVAPLKPAADAHTLDTSALSIEQVVDRVMSIVRKRLG